MIDKFRSKLIKIQDNLNNHPRKILGFMTPLEIKISFIHIATLHLNITDLFEFYKIIISSIQ